MNPTTPGRVVTNVTGAEELFLEVKETFLLSISAEERAQFSSCRSPAELVESIATFSSGSEKSGFKRTTEQIESFSKKLQPYFDILGIFVSSNPEWAAIAWGALRLVLQVCEVV